MFEGLEGDGEGHGRIPAPLLSILIPVYNVRDYLEACVESIVAQADKDAVEIILLDDASTDGSRQVAERLCARFPGRLQFHAQPTNGGLSAARNAMLERARGDYVWFIDSDDLMLPGVLQTLMPILKDYQPDIVLCDFFKKKDHRHVSGFTGTPWSLKQDRDALLRGIFTNRMLYAWLRISRRALWAHDLRFPIGRVFEDVATTPRLALRARSFFYVPQPWIFYRFRPESIMQSVRGGRFDAGKHDDFVAALNDVRSELAARLPSASDATLYRIAYFMAKEFTKICYRLLKSGLWRKALRPVEPTMRRYYLAFNACSPIPFEELARIYLQRKMVLSWVILRFFLSRAHSRRAMGP